MAVEYYTGETGNSNLMYALAHTLCRRMNTCRGNKAVVNRAIMVHFVTAQDDLQMGQCNAAQQAQQFIVSKMTIPLIQGILQYAFPMLPKEEEEEEEEATKTTTRQDGQDNNGSSNGKGHIHKQLYEQHEAKASVFGLAMLPLIHDCNEQDAKILLESVVKIGSTDNRDFEMILESKDVDGYYGTIKAALERNYKCLGISCADIGGVWDPITKAYHRGAEPCVDTAGIDSDTEGSALRDPIDVRDHVEGRGKVGIALTLLVGGIVFILVTAFLADRMSTHRERDTSTLAETEQFYDVDLGPALNDDGAVREFS